LLAEPVHAGIDIIRPRRSPFGGVVLGVTGYLHVGRGALRTWRYATSGTVDVARRSGRERWDYGLTQEGRPAAIGFEAVVDALEVTVQPPVALETFSLERNHRRLRQLRLDKFCWDLRLQLGQTCGLDPFLSRWLTEVVAAVIARAAATYGELGQIASIPQARWSDLATEVLDGVLFVMDGGVDDEQPLRTAVLEALDRRDVVSVVEATLPLLATEPDEGWLPWLRARYLQTLGAAWQAAAQRLCPDFDVEDDSLLDVVDLGYGCAQFFFSDASVGGGGLIETLVGRISEDPRRFDYLVLAALEPSDLEDVDRSLRSALTILNNDHDVATCASDFRLAKFDRLDRWKSLVAALATRGVSTSHAAVSALAARLFRSGSSPASDEAVRRCLERWDELETSAGFAIDHRSACALLAEDSAILEALRMAVPAAHSADNSWAQSVLLGLLWVSAEARRPVSLTATNRFVDDAPPTERTLVLDSLGDILDEVDVDNVACFDVLSERLGRIGRCRLFSGSDDQLRLKTVLAELAVRPIELGFLHVYPRLDGLRRDDRGIHVELSLEESPQ